MANLTEKEVLNAIFNPLLPLGELIYKDDIIDNEQDNGKPVLLHIIQE